MLLLHKITFHFNILRVFSLRVCIWYGNDIRDFANETISQKLLYNHLIGGIQNFPCFRMFKLQLKVIKKNVCSQLIFVQNQQSTRQRFEICLKLKPKKNRTMSMTLLWCFYC